MAPIGLKSFFLDSKVEQLVGEIGIVNTRNDLLEKASAQLHDARKTKTADLHNFKMLKQSSPRRSVRRNFSGR